MSGANHSNHEDKATGEKPAVFDDPLIGSVLAGRYKILELIGIGGAGTVYKGVHLSLGNLVAIKVIHKHLTKDEKSRKRFEQEGRLLNQLTSSRIVRVFDHGIEPTPYLVMEFFNGITLEKWLSDNGAMTYQMAIEMFVQLSEGLADAEEVGLVHRDLKPANIMLRGISSKENPSPSINRKFECKILDFGLAKLMEESAGHAGITATGEIMGSPPYMAPEQWAGQSDARSDIYSFACIMYETLTGSPVFSCQFGLDYMKKHMSESIKPLSQVAPHVQVPKSLERIIHKCLEKAPEKRFQTFTSLRTELRRIMQGRRRMSLAFSTVKKNGLIAVAAAILLSLFAGIFVQKDAILYALYKQLEDHLTKTGALNKDPAESLPSQRPATLAPLIPPTVSSKTTPSESISEHSVKSPVEVKVNASSSPVDSIPIAQNGIAEGKTSTLKTSAPRRPKRVERSAWIARGDQLFADKRYGRAIESYRRAIEENPSVAPFANKKINACIEKLK